MMFSTVTAPIYIPTNSVQGLACFPPKSFIYLLIIFGCTGSLLLCKGFSLVMMHGLLIVVASLVAEYGL